LAQRHQIGVLQLSLQKGPKITAMDAFLGFSAPYMARLAPGLSHRQAGNSCGLASLVLPQLAGKIVNVKLPRPQ
jgi:hypothetical protein